MEHKGEIFEPGKLYKFKDHGPSYWVVGKLERIDPDGRFRCKHGQVSEPFDMIAELSANELGTIVQKPVELINGKCYAFDSHGKRHVGLFCYAEHMMITMGVMFGVDECSNFVELVERDHG
jgi:hypothetical protein